MFGKQHSDLLTTAAKSWLAILGFCAVLFSAPASAGLILQDERRGAVQIQVAEPLGQSFTAEDESVLIAFSFFDVNTFNPNLAITVNLLDGDGLGGSVIASVTQILPEGLGSISNGVFVDFDFTSVSLTVGDSYTALIDAPNSRWGIDDHTDDLYAGGTKFRSGVAAGEMRFRVTPDSVSVPAPATLVLFVLGLIGLGLPRRKRG